MLVRRVHIWSEMSGANHVVPAVADQGKLPDFIKRLEEALYKTAKSRVGVAWYSCLAP